MKTLRNPATCDADNAKKVSSLCGIEAHLKNPTLTQTLLTRRTRCGIVWNLAARDVEFKLQIRHHDGVDTVLSQVRGRDENPCEGGHSP